MFINRQSYVYLTTWDKLLYYAGKEIQNPQCSNPMKSRKDPCLPTEAIITRWLPKCYSLISNPSEVSAYQTIIHFIPTLHNQCNYTLMSLEVNRIFFLILIFKNLEEWHNVWVSYLKKKINSQPLLLISIKKMIAQINTDYFPLLPKHSFLSDQTDKCYKSPKDI